MNGRFSHPKAARQIMHLQQFACCARTQRESRIYRLGSDPAFAAWLMSGWSGNNGPSLHAA